MDLSFYPLNLEAIDAADAESLVLFVAADERPLTGLAGLADWRLSGRLSRMLRAGLVKGVAGEALLTPPGARLGFKKLFLFGLGPSTQGEDELVAQLGDGLRRLGAAGVIDAALQLPARLSIDLGIRTLIDELQGPRRALVFGPDPARLVSALSQIAARGSGSAQLERRVIRVPTPVKPSLPVKAPQAARPPAPLQIPKARPLPFAPSAQPAPVFTPLPPLQLPRASALPFTPSNAAEAPLARAHQAGPAPASLLPAATLAQASLLPAAAPAASLAGAAQAGAAPSAGATHALAQATGATQAAAAVPVAAGPEPAAETRATPAAATSSAAATAPAPAPPAGGPLAKGGKPEKPPQVLRPAPPPPTRFVPPPPRNPPLGKGKKRGR